MKSEDLLMGLTELEDDLILDARKPLRKTRPGRRRFMTLLAAVITVSILGITALAAGEGTPWLRDFFARKSDFVLSDNQQHYIEENVVAVQNSQTHDGYTLMLDTAISDGVYTYIRFQLTAPAGEVLDAGNYLSESLPEMVNEEGDPFIGDCAWGAVDDDPTDNITSLLIIRSHNWDKDSYDSILGHSWTLRIKGLYAHYSSYSEETGFETDDHDLTDGVWEFTITFPEQGNEEVEFITEPASCPLYTNIGITGWHYEDVSITSLKVRALSASLYFRHPEEEFLNGRFDPIYAVMNDGSMARLIPTGSAPDHATFQFDAPIVVGDIDHILLPTGTQLPMPQE